MLCLLFTITKMIKSKGILVIESHIEKPEESTIFQKYPRIMHDHFAIAFICRRRAHIKQSFRTDW